MEAINERHALNDQSEESNKRPHYERTNLANLVGSDLTDILLKAFFAFLAIPFFVSILFYSIYDTECAIFDHASVINCSQNFFTSNPEHWVFAWLLMSFVSSSIFVLIVWRNHTKLNYQLEKAKKIYRQGSFGSLVFQLAVTLVYYAIRIDSTKCTGTIRVLTSILVFLWLPVKLILVCCFNYLPQVNWKQSRVKRFTFAWLKNCLTQNSNFFIYWLSLLLYFIEVACKFAAIMLDVALELAPLIENNFPDKSVQLRGVMVIVIGIRLAYHASLLSFFWAKIFHGNSDMFSEPEENLLEQNQCEEGQEKTPKQKPRQEIIQLDVMGSS